MVLLLLFLSFSLFFFSILILHSTIKFFSHDTINAFDFFFSSKQQNVLDVSKKKIKQKSLFTKVVKNTKRNYNNNLGCCLNKVVFDCIVAVSNFFCVCCCSSTLNSTRWIAVYSLTNRMNGFRATS